MSNPFTCRVKMNRYLSDMSDLEQHMNHDPSGTLKELYMMLMSRSVEQAKEYIDAMKNPDGIEIVD
ncbi:MAG TPA: hypothetical protein VF905_01740 [Nitrospirota bacterium]